MTGAYLQEQFRSRLNDLPGDETVRELRERAMAAFGELGFPTRKLEDWRYTDLRDIARAEFNPVPDAPSEKLGPQILNYVAALDLAKDEKPIVFMDGHLVGVADNLNAPEGLEISSLDETWSRSLSLTTKQYGDRPLAALNAAFATNGLHLRASAGSRIERPLHLVFATSGRSEIAPQPRILIDLDSDSSLTVALHYVDEGGAAWTNIVTDIALGERSRLTLYRVQRHDVRHLHTELIDARVAADAGLVLGSLDMGGRLVRNDIHVDLAQRGAFCDLFGVFLADDGRHIDNHIRVDHSAPATISRENFKGIVGDRARGVFNGKVVVHKDAQQIDAKQSSDNLLLAESGEIDTKPELEIYADDVKCSHGATVGQLDSDQLFYLRARGLDDDMARSLLIFAFANELLRRFALPGFREHLSRLVLSQLPGRQEWDELL